MNTDDEAEFEPLSEHEQAMLDRLHMVEASAGFPTDTPRWGARL